MSQQVLCSAKKPLIDSVHGTDRAVNAARTTEQIGFCSAITSRESKTGKNQERKARSLKSGITKKNVIAMLELSNKLACIANQIILTTSSWVGRL